MEKDQLSRKLAVILHADVVGSTSLVHQNESLAHQRIQSAFKQLSAVVKSYNGSTRELRGDALLAEFERASDAVSAALAFQASNKKINAEIDDDIKPQLRIGISLGEVVVADDTITGAGVVLAQRVEQLSDPDGVCITGALHEAIPRHMPFELQSLGKKMLKGFDDPIDVYASSLSPGKSIPPPEQVVEQEDTSKKRILAIVGIITAVFVISLGLWLQSWESEVEDGIGETAVTTSESLSIAVLPFRDISASERSALMGDGIGESIVTALAKIPQLFVISRRTSFAYKDSPKTIQQIGEALKTRYILEGSIQLIDDNLRITAQCVDTRDGHHVWAQQYDRTLENIFEIQDDITRNVAEALEIELAEGEQARYRQGQTDNVAAYEDFLKGLQHYRRFTPADNDKAVYYFEQAMAKDPGFLHARAEVGWAELNRWRFRWGSEPKQSLERARELAQAALRENPNHSTANALLGTIYRYEKQFDLAIEHGKLSVEAEPSGADITATLATTYLYAGESSLAMKLIERAIQLSPKHPSWYFYTLGAIQRELGQYDKAVASHEQWRKRNKKSPNPLLALIYSYTLAGQLEDARNAAAEVLRRQPEFSVAKWTKRAGFKDPEVVNKIAAAMRQAGLPD